MERAETEYQKPLPVMAGMTKEFYENCARGELCFQRCAGCEKLRHVPTPRCAGCGSWNWVWSPSNGRGKLVTWTVVRRPMHPDFVDDTPYAPAVIELDEGVRMLSWIVDCPPEDLSAGMRVEVVFDEVTSEVTLPKFRRVAS
ncbi:MAG: hypothetical protein CL908_24760 [Deltaproteobacteria bacterium]|nr:hypothetical protein [Deltaproteobacteria bacterium]